MSANTLAFGCFLLFWGRIADIYGKKTMFVLGSGWMAITAAINPFLPNEIAFYVFRALQGLVSLIRAPTVFRTTPGRGLRSADSIVPVSGVRG